MRPTAASSNRFCRRCSVVGWRLCGMKSLGGGGQPILHGLVTAEEALRYAMSLPVATTICGIDSLSILRQNLALARTFKPMTADEMDALRQRCALMAAIGTVQVDQEVRRRCGARAARLSPAGTVANLSQAPNRELLNRAGYPVRLICAPCIRGAQP
jgi:hypothetical protein